MVNADKTVVSAESVATSGKLQPIGAELQDVARLALEMSHANGVDEVLALAAEQLYARVQPDFLIMHVCEDHVLRVQQVLPAENPLGQDPDCIPSVGECLCGLACSENRFVCAGSGEYAMHCKCAAQAHIPIRAFAAMPVLQDGAVVAVLGFGSQDQRNFRAEQDYIEALVAQVGVVLSNVALRAGLEAALQESHMHLKQQEALQTKFATEAEFNRVLIDRAAEGICVSHEIETPPYVAFTVWNRKMTDLTGYNMEEINRLGWFDTMFPDSAYREAAIERTQRIREGRDMESEDWTIRHRDGSARVLSLSSCNFDDISMRHTLVTLEDRTAERRAQQESEKLHDELQGMMRMSALGEAASSLLHELNQPLAAVSTNTASLRAILQRGGDDRKMVQDLVDEIDVDTQRASALVARLRQYLRKGPVVDAREPCDLHDVIRDVLRILSGAMKRQGVQVTIDLTSSPSIVMGDKMELEQVVMNLVMNAMDALQEVSDTGQIRIHTKVDASGCIICSVLDHGHGFPPEMLARAFEPFATTKDAGLGLGLPICKRVIEGHGGRIWIAESDLLVTNIVFCLPLWSST